MLRTERMIMTREEYLHKLLYDHNRSKSKQTANPKKYPQGYFKPKKCRNCGKEFIPKAPQNTIVVNIVRSMGKLMSTTGEYTVFL